MSRQESNNSSKKRITQSKNLKHVCYDIRGPVLATVKKMEEDGQRVIKLNIGNLGVFGFSPPDEIQQDIIHNLSKACPYSDAQGIFDARKAVMHHSQEKNVKGVSLDDVYIGNGASELIMMSMNGLLDPGDEVLLPSPDYPLWTAAVSLSGGTPKHYLCNEDNNWQPDLADMEAKISKHTKAIVIINPNNPTGVIYSNEILLEIIELARRNGLIIFSDEVYDKFLYDGHTHTSIASLSSDVLTITINSLSKNYRACGYRAGWLFISGDKTNATSYLEGLHTLASMRLCPNVPSQYGIQTALGGYQSIETLVGPEGRLTKQRDIAYELIQEIPGISCVKPMATPYLFPKLDPEIYPIKNDRQFILDLLRAEQVLLVQGTGFNWVKNDHFRLVFLPYKDELTEAIARIARFLECYRNQIN